MAKMTWFRYHADVLNNKRVQKLPPDLFKFWVNCQCVLAMENAPASGKMPDHEDAAYLVRMSVENYVKSCEYLVDNGLMMKRNVTKCNENETESETKCNENETESETLFSDESHAYYLKNWGKKQYKSDSSTDRVKRFRERSKDVSRNAPESDPDQISDTESDQMDPDKILKNFGGDSIGSGFGSDQRAGSGKKIRGFLHPDDIKIARAIAPGWDVDMLMEQFDKFIAKNEFPKQPSKAFIEWVKRYTKGKK